MRNVQQLYLENSDGFLHFADWLQHHPVISRDVKIQVVTAFIDEVMKPARKMQSMPTNPATLIAQGVEL